MRVFLKKCPSIAIMDWQGTRSLPASFVHTPTRASQIKKTKPYGFLYPLETELLRRDPKNHRRSHLSICVHAPTDDQHMKFFTQQYSNPSICVFKASSPPSDEVSGSIQLCFFSSFLLTEIHPSLTPRSCLMLYAQCDFLPLH